MAIFELGSDLIRKLEETTFSAVGIRERADLQRLLRTRIDTISPDTLVIAEEFGEWEDSKRRIDLLGVDRDANLVVIELKRTEDGGHMELQAIRYAAMVSTMTFVKVLEIYTNFLRRIGSTADARSTLLEFLEWDEPDETRFGQDVRIILVSAEFSKELTTAVMWLNEHNLDIRCVRIKPYSDGGRVLIDVQHVIPLPEAAEYQVQIRDKEQKGRQERTERHVARHRFWESLLARAVAKTSLHANISAGDYGGVGAGSGVRGLAFNYSIRQEKGMAELYIDRGDEQINKRIFDSLHDRRADIELAFGGELSWLRLDDKRASRIVFTGTLGGLESNEANWPAIQDEMIDAMIRLEYAIKPHLGKIQTDVLSRP
jgi:hypothetical protein